MTAIKRRLERLERASQASWLKTPIIFIRESPADDAALAEARALALKEGRIIFINWITDPPSRKDPEHGEHQGAD